MNYSFEIVRMPAQPAVLVAATCRHEAIGETLMGALQMALEHAVRHGASIAGPPFARYLCWREEDCDLEGGLPVDRSPESADNVRAAELGGCTAAKTVHSGPYAALSDAHRAAIAWIDRHGYRVAGAPWESYVDDPADVEDPARLRTEIYWPIEG